MEHLGRTGTVSTSVLVAFEVFRGCRNQREERATANLFTVLPTIDIDRQVAETAAHIVRSRPGVFSSERSTADALIAGTAFIHSAALVTLNTRQFTRLNMPGVEVLALDQRLRDWVAGVS
jgi:predicted nucleic acid-binding protein